MNYKTPDLYRCLVHEVGKKDFDTYLDALVEQCEAYHWGYTWD